MFLADENTPSVETLAEAADSLDSRDAEGSWEHQLEQDSANKLTTYPNRLNSVGIRADELDFL